MKRLALVVWVAWALAVAAVVFDHTIEVAGRRYLRAASLAAQAGGSYARIDDWMRPAVATGLASGGAAGAVILLVGLAALRVAERRMRPAPPSGSGLPCA